MNYNLSLLVSVAQCDTYLQELNTDLSNLNIRLGEVQAGITSNTTIASVLPTQLASVESALLAKQAELAATTDVAEQRSIEMQINILENKRFKLLNRQDVLAGAGLLDKQFKVAKYESEIAAINEFITAIETRKSEILAAAA